MSKLSLGLLIAGLVALIQSATAQPPPPNLPASIVTHTCVKAGGIAGCDWGGPRAIVLRSNSEEAASYPLGMLPADAAGGNFVSVSAASYQGPVLAAGAIASGFGQNLATTAMGATTVPLPTSLAGTTVTITDSAGDTRLAPLFYVSPTQINYLIPGECKMGDATVRVVSGDGTVSNGTLTLEAVAPGLISANSSGQGVAAAQVVRVKQDNSVLYDWVFQWDAGQAKFVTLPIDPGPETDQIFLTLFGTGFQNRSDLSAVKVRVDGVDCNVLYAGPQGGFVGLDQLNINLPRMLGGRGELELELTVDGKAANVVTIATGGPVIVPPPQIVTLNPNAGVAGQAATAFTISGQNLDSVTGIEFFPPTGVTATMLSATSTLVTGQLAIAADAATGNRQVAVISPVGRSNKLPFAITVPGPRITSLNPNSGQTGQTISLTIAGDNLGGVTAIQFTPPTGITIGNLAASSNMVSAQVTIASDAQAGSRSVQVNSSLGLSNTLSFTVQQAPPQIVSVIPDTASPGQVISNFTITGQNLAGVTAITFSPSTGITVGAIVATATTVTAPLTVASNAPTGMRSVSVVSPAGLSNSLTFTVAAAAPQIASLSPDSGTPGQVISAFTITGQNLADVTAINFSPSSGITVTGLTATATSVTAQVTLAANAAAGARSVSVTSPAGTSNTLTFTVQSAAPQINSLSPNSGNQGQTIQPFTIAGQNLSGVTAINFSPSTGIAVSGISTTANSVSAHLAIASDAATGARSVTVTSPAGASNALTFTVNKPASPIPVISNVVLDTPTTAGPMVTFTGHFDFTDGDGDIVYTGSDAGSAKLKISFTSPSTSCTTTTYGSFLNKPGQTSGAISFSITTTWNVKITGSFFVNVSLIDGAGHESNVAAVSVTTWYCRLAPPNRDGNRPLEIAPAAANRRRDPLA